MRTLTAPGVEWREIDRSQYSPSMTGTACFIPAFTNKGEPYKTKEFTSRSAWTTYYGEPDNEAERYAYAAACEVLNQGGRCYTARLPYDNAAFEKMVGVKYRVEFRKNYDQLSGSGKFHDVSEVDSEIKDAFVITGGKDPSTYELTAIDEYRTKEANVPAGTFLIVDTTGATYGKVTEDTRMGQKREVIGIVPVVTTAANAMYAQSIIQPGLSVLSAYETISGKSLKGLKFESDDGTMKLSTDGLSSTDMAILLNTNGKYYNQKNLFKSVTVSVETNSTISSHALLSTVTTTFKTVNDDTTLTTSYYPWKTVPASAAFERYAKCENGFYLCSDSNSNSFADVTKFSPVLSGENNDTIIGWCGTLIGPYAPCNEWHAVDGSDAVPTTLALDANNYFSTIQPAADGEGLDPEHLKDIGVVVYKMYLDPTEGNKVSYEAVEAYCGSLYAKDVDPNTGVTKFIDTIINSQSNYINFFSNCFNSKTEANNYLTSCDILIAEPSQGATLGLYSDMTKEDISIDKSILDGLNKSFEKIEDLNLLDIDIVCDAGIANIASYLKAIFGNKGPYDLTITDDLGNSMLGLWTCKKATDPSVKMWKTVEQKFDTFCKKTRKDCMFIADGMRPLVLQGQKKIIRDTKPANTIDANILPYFPAICGLNTSYGAGYCDWFEMADDYTGDFFWCPPSIKAMGVYINTDVNYNYWDAPAGLNRGMIAATDVSFSPTPKQAGCFYEKNWNYAINYPADGIVLEGQKTFQVKPSAFDRVNVRRLFLRLERQCAKVSKYFLYEGNTAYTRQRLVDAIDPYFKSAVAGGGIYSYKIVCDDTNNTATTIDNNELHVSIGIKPTKTIEYIMLNFIAGSTGMSWEEIMG